MYDKDVYEYFADVPSERTALITDKKEYTFGQLKKKVDKIVNHLNIGGVSEQNTLGFLFDNPVQKIVGLLVACRTNSLFFNLNEKYPGETITKIIKRVQPRQLLVSSSLKSKLEKPILENNSVETDSRWSLVKFNNPQKKQSPPEAEVLLFTSGTTDIPKGVFHSREDLIFTGGKCFEAWDIKPAENFLPCMPLFSAATLGCVVIPSLCFGQTMTFPRKRKPRFLVDTLNDKNPSFLIGTPTVFTKIISYLNETNSSANWETPVRGTVAGAAIPEGFVPRVKEKLNIKLYPHYGMTELLAITSTRDGGNFETVGKPLKNIEVKTSENGRIIVKSPSMASGYLDKNRDLPVRDGWFFSKDRGKIDSSGNLHIEGRLDNMINRGGNNIFPAEIEGFLDGMENISNSAVVGLADSTFGEKVVAVISNSRRGPDKEEIQQYLESSLEDYKVPDRIVIKDSLPQSDSGKIDRQRLKEELTKG